VSGKVTRGLAGARKLREPYRQAANHQLSGRKWLFRNKSIFTTACMLVLIGRIQ
jgi:hypothetical protein